METNKNRVVVTVVGKDRKGIIAAVSGALAEWEVNILDISQTILQEYFTMVMLVDTSACTVSIGEMRDILEKDGEAQNLSIRIQREDIFDAMHKL